MNFENIPKKQGEEVIDILNSNEKDKEEYTIILEKMRSLTIEKLIPILEQKDDCEKIDFNQFKKNPFREEILNTYKERYGEKIVMGPGTMPDLVMHSINKKLNLDTPLSELPEIVSFPGNKEDFHISSLNNIVLGFGHANDIISVSEELFHFFREKCKKNDGKDEDIKNHLKIAISELYGRLGEDFAVKNFPEFVESHYRRRDVSSSKIIKIVLSHNYDKNRGCLEEKIEAEAHDFISDIELELIDKIKDDPSQWERIYNNFKKNFQSIFNDFEGIENNIKALAKLIVISEEENNIELREKGFEKIKNLIFLIAKTKLNNLDSGYGHVFGYSLAEIITEEVKDILEPKNFRKLLLMTDKEILDIYGPVLRKEIE